MEETGPWCAVKRCGTALVSSEISTSYEFPSGFLLAGRAFQAQKRFDLAQSQKIHEEEHVFGEGMLLPFIFGSVNVTPFLWCFS